MTCRIFQNYPAAHPSEGLPAHPSSEMRRTKQEYLSGKGMVKTLQKS